MKLSPFGRFKQSGVALEMGMAGLEEFLERETFAVAVAVPGVA
jgi:acyl-CoA reductase-like NAD-dependent aldehyde dehydrogenase